MILARKGANPTKNSAAMEAVLLQLKEAAAPASSSALPSGSELAADAKKARKSKKRRSDALDGEDVDADRVVEVSRH